MALFIYDLLEKLKTRERNKNGIMKQNRGEI